MNRIVIIAAFLLFSGCGSSGDPVFGGFTPTGGSAVIFDSAVCDIGFVGPSAVSGIVLDFTSYPDSCEVINETSLCGNKASATRVLAFVLSGEVGAASTDPAGPGNYSFQSEPPSGSFKASIAQAVQSDATCEPLSDDSNLAMTGGSINITSVTATTVSGSTSINFEQGNAFEHTFDLTLCETTLDMCDRFRPCMDHVCVP
jgi:hypothetical protein